jgi:HAD superfamily hydrolase (TIGR01509 family)
MTVDPSRLKAIVFDVDGTLYRQGGLRRAMLLRLVRAMAMRPATGIATFRALRAYRHAQELLRGTDIEGGLAAAQLRLASERSGQSELVVAEIVARWMEQEPLPLLERFVEPSLRAFLAAARGRGLALGVFSDYPAASKLAAMRLTEFFDVVVAAQDVAVNRFKPHPSGLAEALRRLGASPDEALYVGDRHDVDGAVARALGVPCVIVGGRGKVRASAGWTPISGYRELHGLLFPFEPPLANPRTP